MSGLDEPNLSTTADHPNSTILPPELYARRVWAFSQRSGAHVMYPGKHYASIARLLISTYQSLGDEASLPSDDPPVNFITLHDLAAEKDTAQVNIRTLQDLAQYEVDTTRKEMTGQILFLHGYPSARWLCQIGSKFNIDPEFYYRHLDFTSLQGNQEHFFMHSLPSSADILRLRVTTILSCNDLSGLRVRTPADLRADCQRHIANYVKDLISGRNMATSNSIVRKFNVHDMQHYSIEQLISICVTMSPKGWTVIVWLDSAGDLGRSACGPWIHLQRGSRTKDNITVVPIIQYRRRMALKREPIFQMTGDQTLHVPSSLPQSAAHLAPSYGRTLRSDIMECDAFYSMNELFRFSIASESQFLELMKLKISRASDFESGGEIKELRISLELIQDHHQVILENMDSVRRRGHSKWPKAENEKLRKRAEAAAEQLEADYLHLSAYAKALEDRCKDGISILMNDAIYRQSETATAQTRETIKLTLLAFFFVPLTFTTSVFSMQVEEIAKRNIRIWIWVVVSVVLLFFSFVFWRYNALDVVNAAWKAASLRLSRLSRSCRRYRK